MRTSVDCFSKESYGFYIISFTIEMYGCTHDACLNYCIRQTQRMLRRTSDRRLSVESCGAFDLDCLMRTLNDTKLDIIGCLHDDNR